MRRFLRWFGERTGIWTLKYLFYKLGILYDVGGGLNIRILGGWFGLRWRKDGKCPECGIAIQFGMPSQRCGECWRKSPEGLEFCNSDTWRALMGGGGMA